MNECLKCGWPIRRDVLEGVEYCTNTDCAEPPTRLPQMMAQRREQLRNEGARPHATEGTT